MSPYEKSEGIVLKHADYSESSQVVWFLTRGFGKVRVLAKGSRRQGKRAPGALDLMTRCGIVMLRRVHSGLHLLTDWQVRESFPGLRTGLKRLYAGLYAAELVLRMVEESEDHPQIYDLFLESLRELEKGGDRDITLFRFELGLLRELGLAPRTAACARCDCRPGPQARFSAAAGGALCGNCARLEPAAARISAGALATMTRLGGNHPRSLAVSASMRREIRKALSDCFSSATGRPARMAPYVQSWAAGEEPQG